MGYKIKERPQLFKKYISIGYRNDTCIYVLLAGLSVFSNFFDNDVILCHFLVIFTCLAHHIKEFRCELIESEL